jgi:tetratricopeptide (TPR) repeat protein
VSRAFRGIIAELASDDHVRLGALIRIERAIPGSTAALAEIDLILTRRINDMLKHDTRKKVTAHWRLNLGSLYSQVGRPAEAVSATEEAVAIRRELEAAQPGRHRTEFGRSLDNLAIVYSKADQLAEALPLAEESVAIFRDLAADNPHRYSSDLADSLKMLANCYSELGRQEDAESIRKELERPQEPGNPSGGAGPADGDGGGTSRRLP